LGNRRSERRGRQTQLEAHYADPQDAEAGDFPAWCPEQPGRDRTSNVGAGPAAAIVVTQITIIESLSRSALDRPAPAQRWKNIRQAFKGVRETSVIPPGNTAFTLIAFVNEGRFSRFRMSVVDKIHCPLYGRGAGSSSHFKSTLLTHKSCQQAPIHREERRLLFSLHRKRVGIPFRQVCIY
jgi:hypothetical protein